MIYAVEILDRKFVKVGFSANDDLSRRIADLQTGNPFQIVPILTTFGTLRQEKEIHAALQTAFFRIRIPVPPNEWYPGRHPFMTELLEHLKFGPDFALSFADKKNPAVRQFGHRMTETLNRADILRWPKAA